MKSYLHALLFIIAVSVGGILGYLIAHTANSDKQSKPADPGYQELTSWQLLQLAITKTESEFDKYAVGKSGDWGGMQETAIFIEECNRLQDSVHFEHIDAFDPYMTYRMFNIYQAAKNEDRNIEKAIRLHNPKADSIAYKKAVMRNIVYLEKLEEFRREVVKW